MKYIDLTQTYNENTVGFEMTPSKQIQNDGWNASNLNFYSHSGTHMDAPTHFEVSKETIDKITISNFFAEKTWIVKLINLPDSYLMTKKDIEKLVPNFNKGDSLIIRTDWSLKVNTDSYRNNLPRISEDLAIWCIEKRVKILGVEPPSVADVNNIKEVTRIHKILLGDVIIIEGLCNLQEITKECVSIIALPLKIKNGDGAPCRVIAIEH
jgi:kynurenine formamidase